MWKRILLTLLPAIAILLASCSERPAAARATLATDPAPGPPSPGTTGVPAPGPSAAEWLPLAPGTTLVYEGPSEDGFERTEVSVDPGPYVLGGETCAILVEMSFVDGALAEQTRSWVTRQANGDLALLREDVKAFAGGMVVGTEGSWEAGVDDAEPGLLVPGTPAVGDTWRIRSVPGVTGDTAEVLSLDAAVTLSDGTTYTAMRTREWDPENPDEVEYKDYVAGLGVVREESTDGTEWTELVEVRTTPLPARMPAVATVDAANPLFPLVPGTRFVYEGDGPDGRRRVEVRVRRETEVILAVPCAVVDVHEFLDGDLVERTTEWYTVDAAGAVWLMGEATEEIEAGVVTSTEGSWTAGAAGAEPGVLIPADPRPGDTWAIEAAPGAAADRAEVVATDLPIVLADGTPATAVRVREWDPDDPDEVDYKDYVSGLGLVREEPADGSGTLDLVSVDVEPVSE